VSAEAWLLAARPRTLPAAIAPVVVASALAFRDDVFRPDALIVTLAAALAIQIGVNFANDLADAQSGADSADRIGPTRAVASGLLTASQMKRGIAAAFVTAAVLGIYLIALGGWLIAVIGVASIVAALAYTGGPWPYGYHGLGEAFVFTFFGLAATVGTRWVYDRSAPADVWSAGVVMGLLAAAILEANNVRDLDTDRTAGKRTLAVVVGRSRARILYAVTVVSAFVVVAATTIAGILPPWSFLALPLAGLAVPLVRTIATETEGPPLIGVLVGTARLQLAVAGALAVAAFLP